MEKILAWLFMPKIDISNIQLKPSTDNEIRQGKRLARMFKRSVPKPKKPQNKKEYY